MMPKPVCVSCKRFFKPFKNGIYVLEQMPEGNDMVPGTEMEENWRPYKIWRADLLWCEGCGKKIVSGFGMQHMAEHYESGFDKFLAELRVSGMLYTVNDCC
jgi:hypothetical protein